VTFVLLRAASRADTRGTAVAITVGAGVLFLALRLLLVLGWPWQWIWRWDMAFEITGELMGAAVITLLWALFPYIVHPRRFDSSVERADWATLGATLWCTWYLPIYLRNGLFWGLDPVVPIQLFLGVAVATAVALRIRRRRSWLRRVAQQRVPGWRIVETADRGPSHLPILLKVDDPTAGVLVRAIDAGGQPFRENEHDEAVARVGAVRAVRRGAA
jgi:hypothetical protein